MLSQKLVRSVSAALVLVMGAGCATTADGRKTQAQGTAIGAVAGAILGGAIGYAAGGRNGLARGAAIGAGAGAVAGFAYGTHVAKRKAEYASREAWLDACIASAHRVNSNAYAYSRSLESRIARLESRARAARVAHNKAEARAIQTEAASLKVEARQKTVVVEKELGDQQQAVSEGRGARNYGGLKSEVHSLQETDGTLGRQVKRLAGLENQLDV
jgi:uncharacterized protein YcfJ